MYDKFFQAGAGGVGSARAMVIMLMVMPLLVWPLQVSALELVVPRVSPTLELLVSSLRTNEQIRSAGWRATFFPAAQTEIPRKGRSGHGPGFDRRGALRGGGQPFRRGRRRERRSRRSRHRVGRVVAGCHGLRPRRARRSSAWRDARRGPGWRLCLDRIGRSIDGPEVARFRHRAGTAQLHARQLPERSARREQPRAHGTRLLQHADGRDPGDGDPDPDRGLPGLCPGLDGVPAPPHLVAAIAASLVVTLLLKLVPRLSLLHNAVWIGKGYVGVWLAYTAFGLPREIVDCAGRRGDGVPDLHLHRAAALRPGPHELYCLSVPVDLARPAGGHGLPDRHNRARRPS
ncbi:hypothetical protein SAMN05421539_103377 [Jannaschia seohaensis]|uniref:Uncharacterized protein n=1 Tax=Jannaschia seohaensis TaxID=475081 RepID=A0A2Y9AJH5_9RHOB|nr:hypothetical protein BCF38_103377 [Jannaschia seohaensis]SSA44654.1 hypothetical protein SAMN05421539_103377 [Jannaschia seohaensis]